ncbi:MAG TPA: UPF0182 family protein, partial [Candidatus Limnocylindrales bacterium]
MRDLFDDFMDELRKRQAGQAEGAEPGDSESRPPDDEPGRSGDDTRAVHDGAEAAGAGAVHDRAAAGDARAEDDRAGGGDAPPEAGDDGATDEPEPEPIEAAGRRRTGGGPPRRPRRRGGPNDGGGPRAALGRLGRRFFLGLVIVGLLLLVALLGVGLDLWTDAIWFTSVGYESVFWTRVGTQAVLFVLVFAAALAVLLGNLWIAGRLAPPPDPTRPGSLQGLFERMAESATRQAEGRRRPGRGPFDRYTSDDESTFSPFGGVGGGLGGRGRPPFGARPIVVGGEELPDLTPIARWILAIVALFIALGAAGSMAGSWETILLWVNRVPFAPAGQAPVNDPVFGRDVSFFLFELPFFRLIQGLINGLLLSGLLLALARYVVGALRGSLEFTTPIRLHLALLAGLYLVSVAAGYQLDKYELVYSARGVATGVSYTDANAQFLAFDALTVIAALAGAFLVGGAFTRMVWPLGLAVGIWFLASVVLGQLYPAAVQQFAVIPDQRAKEQPYIVNNVKMTRLAYDIQDWATTEYRGEATLTQAAVDQESATFENARVWDYRPLGSTLDQLQRVRNYYDFFDVDTDRYQLDGALRQVMLSAREIAPDNVPQASSWVNQRINYTHGVGLAYLPVNGATPGGQPDLLIKDLPPQSSDGAPVVSQFR